MKFLDYFKYAIDNILKHKLRSILVVISSIIAMLLMSLAIFLYELDNYKYDVVLDIASTIEDVNELKKFKKNINIGLVIDSSDKVLPINDEVYYCPIDIIGL